MKKEKNKPFFSTLLASGKYKVSPKISLQIILDT